MDAYYDKMKLELENVRLRRELIEERGRFDTLVLALKKIAYAECSEHDDSCEKVNGIAYCACDPRIAGDALKAVKRGACLSTYRDGRFQCEKDEDHINREGDVEHWGRGKSWMSI